MKKLSLQIGDETLSGWALKKGKTLWVHFNGKTFSYSPEKLSDEGASGQAGDPGRIEAPMPGKIVKVTKNVGDTVQAGELVVVMEAMKMEYQLKSLGKGVIKALETKVGKTVDLGDTLVEIEVETSS